MHFEMVCRVPYSSGRTVQAFLHRPQIDQQLVGVRFEFLGERETEIVVAPAAFGMSQGIAQSGISLTHAVPEFGQPRSPISQAVRIQPNLTVHVVSPRSGSVVAAQPEPSLEAGDEDRQRHRRGRALHDSVVGDVEYRTVQRDFAVRHR
ncbi:hypothetical protein ACRS5S_02310 [Nocardia asiatica]|uniref:hypothetical protein n=1 Tax=Nocardia asiatica TaxID=209252 RepID=UPI003EE043FC